MFQNKSILAAKEYQYDNETLDALIRAGAKINIKVHK